MADETPRGPIGSDFRPRRRRAAHIPVFLLACLAGPVVAEPGRSREAGRPLGVQDRGIWPELASRLTLDAPPAVPPDRGRLTVDVDHQLAVLWIDGWPVKPYPLTRTSGGDPGEPLEVAVRRGLRPGDVAELEPWLDRRYLTRTAAAADRDGDGIPDPLDVLLGAKKAAINADAYTEGYVAMSYPLGDVPRTIGVCTDVAIRALRNAGLDLQADVHRDVVARPRAYPMVKRPDPNIDHRRVRTLLPYLLHHFDQHRAVVDDPRDPLRPGDLVLLDTLPRRPGPDHIGVVSDRRGASGLPLVINNWTTGTVTAEMDLLGWVPITHRFRIPSTSPRRR